jgi:DNA end-binding protein Ku
MATRANWKGVLKIGEVSCPVALYTAASTAERIAFHILNRKSGHRVHREYVDAETDERVEAKDQVKGYEIGSGDYIAFEPEEIAKAVPEADKTLEVQAFVPCDQVDDVYLDRPYYLAPSAPAAAEAFTLIRDAMTAAEVAAIARTVLFRRVRSVLIRVHGQGLIANTLNCDYEVRSAEEAFGGWDPPRCGYSASRRLTPRPRSSASSAVKVPNSLANSMRTGIIRSPGTSRANHSLP